MPWKRILFRHFTRGLAQHIMKDASKAPKLQTSLKAYGERCAVPIGRERIIPEKELGKEVLREYKRYAVRQLEILGRCPPGADYKRYERFRKIGANRFWGRSEQSREVSMQNEAVPYIRRAFFTRRI